MARRHFDLRCLALGIALIGASLLMAGPGLVLAHAEHGHPARIHEGTCDDLGSAALRLNGVGGSVDLDGAPVATPTAVNPDSTYQVMVSETVVDVPLDTLLADEHSVMLYESDEEMTAIACGKVGGAMSGDMLITGLAEAGVPGHVGFALFAPDGEQTRVTILIGHAMSPISAGGVAPPADDLTGHDAAEDDHADDDANHDDEGDHHDATATPEA